MKFALLFGVTMLGEAEAFVPRHHLQQKHQLPLSLVQDIKEKEEMFKKRGIKAVPHIYHRAPSHTQHANLAKVRSHQPHFRPHFFQDELWNIENQMNSQFHHMNDQFEREMHAMPAFPTNEPSLSKTGTHAIGNSEFSNVDTTTQCHDGVCLVKRCVNGHCSEHTSKDGDDLSFSKPNPTETAQPTNKEEEENENQQKEITVIINKKDKPAANPERVRQEKAYESAKDEVEKAESANEAAKEDYTKEVATKLGLENKIDTEEKDTYVAKQEEAVKQEGNLQNKMEKELSQPVAEKKPYVETEAEAENTTQAAAKKKKPATPPANEHPTPAADKPADSQFLQLDAEKHKEKVVTPTSSSVIAEVQKDIKNDYLKPRSAGQSDNATDEEPEMEDEWKEE